MTIISDHAYSYRIDYNYPQPNEELSTELKEKHLHKFIQSTIGDWMEQRKEHVVEFMFALEVKSNGQRHYQGIVWTRNTLTDRQTQLFRNVKKKHWVNKVNGSRGYRPVAFTKAKNIESLAKYCNNKEGLGLIKSNGITEEILLEIGKWIHSQSKKKTEEIIDIFKKRFKDIYVSLKEDDRSLLGAYAATFDQQFHDHEDQLRRIIYELAYDVWLEHGKRPPRKQHIIPILHNVLEKEDYLLLQYRI